MGVHDERAALVALLRHSAAGQRWRQTVEDVADQGSAFDVLRAEVGGQLFGDPTDELVSRAAAEIAEWESAGITVVSYFDDGYPSQLRDVHDFPPLLFVHGTLIEHDTGVCVVGSRAAAQSGVIFTRELASALAGEGLTVISGLARGIDTAAHTAALTAGGRTVAVIGTGIDRFYPAENEQLQRRIEADGLVVSQFWPGTQPGKHTFPMRNATMSAYGQATVIVEAAERSGARIQARQAIAHGRPLVLRSEVVATTRWGRTLADNASDVHVVDTVDDALTALGAILQRRHTIDDLLVMPS